MKRFLNGLTNTLGGSGDTVTTFPIADGGEKVNQSSPDAPIHVTVNIESPPVMLFGPPNESSGSLLSGLLTMKVLDKSNHPSRTVSPALTPVSSPSMSRSSSSINVLQPPPPGFIDLTSVEIKLLQVVTYGKPFVAQSSTIAQCPSCRRKTTELARWDVLKKRTSFQMGTEHGYPFSHLIPGSIPATTMLSNAGTTIRYEIVTKVKYVSQRGKEEIMNLSLPVIIRRSIVRGPDRNSVRVFPPTEVTASAVLPNVVYPKSTFPVEFTLENVSSPERRWRMRKMAWRFEESIRMRMSSCDKHDTKLRIVADHYKRQHKHRKVSTKSGGSGVPVMNYYFTTGESANELAPQDSNVNPTSPGLAPTGSTREADDDMARVIGNLDETLDPVGSRRQQTEESLNPQFSNEPEPLPSPHDSEEIQMYHEEIRTIAEGEIKSGWKSDFSNKGRIVLIAEIDIMNLATVGLNSTVNQLRSINSVNCDSPVFDSRNLFGGSMANSSCDISDSELGLYVSHILVVEVVIAEEIMHSAAGSSRGRSASGTGRTPTMNPMTSPTRPQSPLRPVASNASTQSTTSNASSGVGPHSSTGNTDDPRNQKVGVPTGVARVLRMQFKVTYSERSGLGIAWDDEVPPLYQAVSALSPPAYSNDDYIPQTPQTPAYPPPAVTHVSPVATTATPGVLYGLNTTPGMTHARNIDGSLADLDQRLNDFTL